jgi:hypothetical protein
VVDDAAIGSRVRGRSDPVNGDVAVDECPSATVTPAAASTVVIGSVDDTCGNHAVARSACSHTATTAARGRNTATIGQQHHERYTSGGEDRQAGH